MQLLTGINIPPFVRTVWRSEAARKEWQPKIQAAASAYHRLERETVRAGLRRCTTAHFSPESLGAEMRELQRQGLLFLPYKRVGVYQGFAHSHPAVVEGKPWNYYGPIGARIEDCTAFADAEDRGDHEGLAELLGYPACCSEFFRKVWMAGYVDPVWQEAGGGMIRPSILFTGLRYIGVRVAPHLPCSFDCEPSVKMANSWLELARERGINTDPLTELLRLPLEWTCLKGVAEVTTEHFRVVTNSTPCYPKYTEKVQA